MPLILILLLLLAPLVLVAGSKKRSRGMRLAATGGFLLILAFLAGEGLIRLRDGLRYGTWRPRSESMHEVSPYRAHVLRPGYRRYDGAVQHNQQGFRRREETPRDKGDRRRVFFTGGSAAYGTGSSYAWEQPEFEAIDNESTIDHAVEAALGARGLGPVEVINAAAAEYRVHQHLIALFETLLTYEPDIVVFYDGINDFDILDSIDRFQNARLSSQPQFDLVNNPSPASAARLLLQWLKNQSVLIHRAGAWYRLYAIHRQIESALGRPSPTRALAADEEARILARTGDDYLRYARLIVALCRENGVTPVFVVQPILLADATKPLDARETRYRDYEIASGSDQAFMKRRLAAFAGKVEGFCRENDVPFLDLTQPFAGMTAQAYADYCHLTPEGNRVIGERIAAFLAETIPARP